MGKILRLQSSTVDEIRLDYLSVCLFVSLFAGLHKYYSRKEKK